MKYSHVLSRCSSWCRHYAGANNSLKLPAGVAGVFCKNIIDPDAGDIQRGGRTMLFWRAKSAKQAADNTEPQASEAATAPDTTAETTASANSADDARSDAQPVENAAEAAASVADSAAAQSAAPVEDGAGDAQTFEERSGESNVVALTPTRLADRLATLDGKPARAEVSGATDLPVSQGRAHTLKTVDGEAGDGAHLARQSRTHASLRAVMADTSPGSHVLILGPPGTGRRSTVTALARDIARQRAAPPDWIYAVTGRRADVLHAYPVAHGTGERFVRDVQDALAKSSAMLARLVASDSHQMTLAVLEEDHRHRSDGGLDHLKRRAEVQNIALVKTPDGYMLAPMHDGKVVRSDVFRALPDGLQRDVEAKINALELELQDLLVALPGNDVATDDRHLALCQQTAERAIKPNLAMARKLFASDPAVSCVFDAIEADWTRRATDVVHHSGGTGSSLLLSTGLQSVGAEPADGAPVVLARTVTAAELLGEIGRDASGAIAVRAGHLAHANGGFLIVDAWRLAADPAAWSALSSALESGRLQPLASAGLAITAEHVPLDIKVVVIAEPETFDNLKAIDPRFARQFGAIMNYEPIPVAVDKLEAAP